MIKLRVNEIVLFNQYEIPRREDIECFIGTKGLAPALARCDIPPCKKCNEYLGCDNVFFEDLR